RDITRSLVLIPKLKNLLRGRPKKNPGQQSTQEEVVEAGSQNLSSERRVHLIPRKDASGSRSKASGSGSQENDIFRGMGTSNSSRFAIGKEKLGNWERSSKLGRYQIWAI
ncbi:serine/threonine-protein kinase TEL1, partial [Striga asiatica]